MITRFSAPKGSIQPGEEVEYPFCGPGFDPENGVIGEEGEVFVVINYAIFDQAHRAAVAEHMLRVLESLSEGHHPGYIGGSVIVGYDDAWTMSAWRDEASVVAFYGSSVHREAMQVVLPFVEETLPARTKVAARDVPLSWSAAKALCLNLAPNPAVSRRGLHHDHSSG